MWQFIFNSLKSYHIFHNDCHFLCFSLFFTCIEIQWTHGVILVSGVQHTDLTTVYMMLCSLQVQLPSVTVQCYYRIIDCIPFMVSFISVICLFCNWKPIPATPLYPFFPSSPPLPSNWQSPVCSLNLWVCFCFVCCLFCFLGSTYKCNNTVLSFLLICLTYLLTYLSNLLHLTQYPLGLSMLRVDFFFFFIKRFPTFSFEIIYLLNAYVNQGSS